MSGVLQLLSSQPWVERLGWTLLHFLWQGAVLAVLYAAARRGARASRPNVRYLLACAAMAAAPVVTWCLLLPADTVSVAPDRTTRIPHEIPTVAATLPASVRATVQTAEPTSFLPWVVGIWLVGASVLWIRLIGGCVVTARMRSMLVRPAPPEWRQSFHRMAMRIGVSRPIRLLVSALVETPTVVGWIRPVVLVPVGALSGLPAEHLEALLMHELAHIRRHDYLVNVLQGVAEALLFYHPAVWWVSAHMRAERELCCDDAAVALTGDVLTYARALAELESCRPAHLHPALAANGGSVAHRIGRLLGQSRPAVRSGLGPGLLAAAILLATAACGWLGQFDAHPAFQSASIRLSTLNASQRRDQPMGMGVNSSLLLLVQFAYASHDNIMSGHWLPLLASQVLGGPDWIDTEHYNIRAKAKPGADPRQVWLMWRTLLADRFKLRLHRETRELPIFDLTAAPGGPKLPPAKEAACISFPPGTPPRAVPGKVDCGYVSGPVGYSAGLGIVGRKVHVPDLVRELASMLDRPVLDKTGFTGEFDLKLNFTPGEALKGVPSGYGGPADPRQPDIFTALEQQLGLKLVPARGPVEVLVIDHAERPTEN